MSGTEMEESNDPTRRASPQDLYTQQQEIIREIEERLSNIPEINNNELNSYIVKLTYLKELFLNSIAALPATEVANCKEPESANVERIDPSTLDLSEAPAQPPPAQEVRPRVIGPQEEVEFKLDSHEYRDREEPITGLGLDQQCVCDETCSIQSPQSPQSVGLDTSFSNKLLYKISDFLFQAYNALGFTIEPVKPVEPDGSPTIEGKPDGYYSDDYVPDIQDSNAIIFIYVHGGIKVIDGLYKTFNPQIDTFTIKYGIRGVSTLASIYDRYLAYIKIYNANVNDKYDDMNYIIPLINTIFFEVFPMQARCKDQAEYKKIYKDWLTTGTADIIEIKKEIIARNLDAARLTATTSLFTDVRPFIIKDVHGITPEYRQVEEEFKKANEKLVELEKAREEAKEELALAKTESTLAKTLPIKSSKIKAALAKTSKTLAKPLPIKTSKTSLAKTSLAKANLEAQEKLDAAQKNVVAMQQKLDAAQILYSQMFANKVREKLYQPDDPFNNRSFNPDYTLKYIPKKLNLGTAAAPTTAFFNINDTTKIYNNAGNIRELNYYLDEQCIRFEDLGIPRPELARVKTINSTARPSEVAYFDYCPRDIIMLCDIQFNIPRCTNNVTGQIFHPRHVVIKKNDSFITNPHVLEFFIKMFGVEILLRPIYIHSTKTELLRPVTGGGGGLHTDYKFFKSSLSTNYSTSTSETLINYRYKVFPEEITNFMIYKLLYLSGVEICSIFDNSCEDLMCSGIKPDAKTLSTLARTLTQGGGGANNNINALKNNATNNINTMKRHGRNKKTMKRHGRNKKTMKRHGRNKKTMKRHGRNKKTMKRHGRNKKTMKRH